MGAPAKVLRLIPRHIQKQSPTPDLVLRVDRRTLEYTHYQEHRPGTMLVAPFQLLNRRMGDVVPDIANVFDRAIWTAGQMGRPQIIQYTLLGTTREAHVITTGDSAAINIKHIANAIIESTGT